MEHSLRMSRTVLMVILILKSMLKWKSNRTSSAMVMTMVQLNHPRLSNQLYSLSIYITVTYINMMNEYR